MIYFFFFLLQALAWPQQKISTCFRAFAEADIYQEDCSGSLCYINLIVPQFAFQQVWRHGVSARHCGISSATACPSRTKLCLHFCSCITGPNPLWVNWYEKQKDLWMKPQCFHSFKQGCGICRGEFNFPPTQSWRESRLAFFLPCEKISARRRGTVNMNAFRKVHCNSNPTLSPRC